MLKPGEKVKYYGREAIILTSTEAEDEVLIFIDEGYVKWVDKYLLNLDLSA